MSHYYQTFHNQTNILKTRQAYVGPTIKKCCC